MCVCVCRLRGLVIECMLSPPPPPYCCLPPTTCHQYGIASMCSAAEGGHIEVVRLFLDRGVSVDAIGTVGGVKWGGV